MANKDLSKEKISSTYTRLLQINPDDNVSIVNGTGSNPANLTMNSNLTVNSYTANSTGGGIDAVSPTINVQSINGEVVTTIYIDIGAGSIVSSSDADDVIGEEGVAAAYLTRIATSKNGLIYKGEIICLEVPTTGDPDINLAADSAQVAEDVGGMDHVLANCGVHTLALKTDLTIPAGGIQNDYIYLTHGGTTAGTYDAGKFLIRLYGYVV